MALAVGQNITADLIIAIGQYVYARAQQAVRLGRHSGPPSDVPLRLTLATLEYESNNDMRIEGLKIEGRASDVKGALRLILSANRKPGEFGEATEGPSRDNP